MDTTVGALKVGAQLVMGKYGVDKDNPYPLSTTCASMRRKRLGIIGVLIMRSIQCQICFRS